MAKSTIGFSIYLDNKLIDEVTFDRPIINVGKLSTSTLRIDDVNVSRKHAVIEQRDDGTWRVTDLGSTNGTILRGERVVQAALVDGDRLALGTTTLVVHLGQAAEARAETPVAESGVAGDRPAAGASATAAAPRGRAKAEAPAASPDEIRGLGADSFYGKKGAAEGRRWLLDVTLLWGETVLASKSFRPGESVVLGPGEQADFQLPKESLGSDLFALVTAQGQGFALVVSNPNVTGDVLMGDKVQAVAELAETGRTVVLKGAVRARLKVGDFTLLLSHAPERAAAVKRTPMEKEPLLFILGAAALMVTFLIIAYMTPDDLLMSTRDPRAQREKVLQALKITPEQIEEIKKEEEAKKELELQKIKDRVASEELKVDPSEVVQPTEVVEQRQKNPLVDKMQRKREQAPPDLSKLSPEQRRARAAEMAQQTSMARAMDSNSQLFQDLLQTNPDLDAKPSPFKALGAPSNDGSGDWADSGSVNPFGGFDPSSGGPGGWAGTGTGGDPNGGGPILAGKIGKTDAGSGGLTDRPLDPRLVEAPPRIVGELDANTIRTYIRRYLSGVKWCYQDRLQANRKLAGKLTLAFTIMPNGTVRNPATENSTLGDAALDQCITTKMARWKFPQPKDGGVVDVKYPLILKAQ